MMKDPGHEKLSAAVTALDIFFNRKIPIQYEVDFVKPI